MLFKKAQKLQKTLKIDLFTKTFFTILHKNWEVWGCPGGVAWTIRGDSLELWRGLVLHGMGEIDFHVFWETPFITKYLQIGPRASRLVLGFF